MLDSVWLSLVGLS